MRAGAGENATREAPITTRKDVEYSAVSEVLDSLLLTIVSTLSILFFDRLVTVTVELGTFMAVFWGRSA